VIRGQSRKGEAFPQDKAAGPHTSFKGNSEAPAGNERNFGDNSNEVAS